MMGTLALICMLVAGASVEIDLAPDQPLPFVYVDEPLILELAAPEDTEASVHLSVRASHLETPTEWDLGPFPLRAQGRRWSAIKELPDDRGYYTAEVRVMAGGEETARTESFCRIDRLRAAPALPLFAAVSQNEEDRPQYHNGRTGLALRAAGVNTIRWDVLQPDIEEHLQDAKSNGVKVILRVDLAANPSTELIARLVQNFNDVIVRWDLIHAADSAAALADAIRKSGSNAPLALAVASPGEMTPLLKAGVGRYARETIIEGDAADAEAVALLRGTAERAGYEQWRIDVLLPARIEENVAAGPVLLRQIFANLAAGAEEVGFNPGIIYNDTLQEAFVFLNGFAQRFYRGVAAGALSCGKGVEAPVFRKADRWLVALWANGAEGDAVISVGDAQDLQLTDARNNALPLPEAKEGKITLPVDGAVQYLTGAHGAVVSEAARNQAGAAAHAYLADNALTKCVSTETLEVLRRIASDAGSASRDDFFLLLRSLPELEGRWHAGQLPRFDAAPAIAAIARLMRPLCTLEERRGEVFLEPLSDTLARCEEYQSSYLTGSISTAEGRERGDWLLNEVRRLMDEAEALADANLRIEANAVAAVAEWRARGLEYAAQAGTAPEPAVIQPSVSEEKPAEQEPETAPAAPVEEAKPEEEAPTEEAAASDEPKEIIHVIQRGDNPSRIAKKYGVEVADFLKWNNLKPTKTLHIGEKYKVYVPAEKAAQ